MRRLQAQREHGYTQRDGSRLSRIAGTERSAVEPHARRSGEGERKVVVQKVDWRHVWRRRGIGAGGGRCGDGDVGDGFGN